MWLLTKILGSFVLILLGKYWTGNSLENWQNLQWYIRGNEMLVIAVVKRIQHWVISIWWLEKHFLVIIGCSETLYLSLNNSKTNSICKNYNIVPILNESLIFLVHSDTFMTEYLIILCYVEASQVITVNENLPLSPVEPETVTERRTVKMCCCIPKGDVLLNSWYVFGSLSAAK